MAYQPCRLFNAKKLLLILSNIFFQLLAYLDTLESLFLQGE